MEKGQRERKRWEGGREGGREGGVGKIVGVTHANNSGM
jgi:hypothetical protein